MGIAYIVIDGIDECDFPERKTMLSFMTSLITTSDSPSRLRTLFVSQDENDIRKLLRGYTILRLTHGHNKSDIEVYASERSLKIQEKFQLPGATRNYIMEIVGNGSEGKSAVRQVTLPSADSLRHVFICKSRFDKLIGSINSGKAV